MTHINWMMFLTVLFTQPCVWAQDTNKEILMYRYLDEQGNQMISSNLPPEAANKGYAIISPRGNVIEEVPPKLSDSELLQAQVLQENKRIEDEKNKMKEQDRQLEAKKDVMLLKVFTNLSDIERSRDEKISAIEVQEGIIQENIHRLEDQLAQSVKNKKLHEKQNQTLPKQLEDTLVKTQTQIEENKLYLTKRKSDKQQISNQYQKMIERFTYLKEQEARAPKPVFRPISE